MINEPLIANDVADVVGVLTAIDLDNEATFAANKVGYVSTNRLLPHEFESTESARA